MARVVRGAKAAVRCAAENGEMRQKGGQAGAGGHARMRGGAQARSSVCACRQAARAVQERQAAGSRRQAAVRDMPRGARARAVCAIAQRTRGSVRVYPVVRTSSSLLFFLLPSSSFLPLMRVANANTDDDTTSPFCRTSLPRGTSRRARYVARLASGCGIVLRGGICRRANVAGYDAYAGIKHRVR